MSNNNTPAEFPTFYQWMTANRPEDAIVVGSVTPLEDWGWAARGNVDAMQSHVDDPEGMIADHLRSTAEEYSANTDDQSEICADHFQEYAEDGSATFETYDYGKRRALILWAWNADVDMDPFGAGEISAAKLWDHVESFAAYAIESAVSATIQEAADAYAAARQEWEDEREDEDEDEDDA